jgi:serine/threonine protein kinase
MSADQGNALGQNDYGVCLENGEGVPKNLSEAARYFKMAADQGNAVGQNNYAICLERVEGITKDLSEAARYHRLTEDQGEDETGQYRMTSGRLSGDVASLADGIMNLAGFEKVREIGRGRFGIVYLCTNKVTGDNLAVKYIGIGPTFQSDRLLREIAILTAVAHPCIVRIIGYSLPNEECKKARIATELMSNGSLEKVLTSVKNGNIPEFWNHTNITKMIIGLLHGMKYLHSQNIIHRDLKPGNLLIDEKGQIRIADFGTAKFEDCGTTTDVVGTLAYMASETLGGGQATKKSDVFAFGLILYEVLVGESVFPKNGNILQIAEMHMQGIRREIPKHVHPLVTKVIEQCWSKNQEDRPTFEEVLNLLHANWFPLFRDIDLDACDKFISDMVAEETQNLT